MIIFKKYIIISGGIILPLFRPFLIYQLTPDGERSLIFWLMAFQATFLPILTLALFDYSSQVFSKNPSIWRKNLNLYRDFPVQVTAIFSIASSICISRFAEIDTAKSLVAAMWCFASVVFTGQLKILRFISFEVYFQFIALKMSLEFIAYFIFLNIFGRDLDLLIFSTIDSFLCAILTLVIYNKFIKKENSLNITLVERWKVLRASAHLLVGLALASLSVQVDRLLLIKILPTAEYEAYLGSVLFKGVAMSAGAVIASFLYPRFAVHVRTPSKENSLLFRRFLKIFYLTSPFLVFCIALVILAYTSLFFEKPLNSAAVLIPLSIIVLLSLNTIVDSYLFINGVNRVILINALGGVAFQAFLYWILYKYSYNDYYIYLWVGAICQVLQTIYLTIMANRIDSKQFRILHEN